MSEDCVDEWMNERKNAASHESDCPSKSNISAGSGVVLSIWRSLVAWWVVRVVSVSVFGACQSSKDWAALPLYDLPSGWLWDFFLGATCVYQPRWHWASQKWQVNSIAPLAGSLFGHTGNILKLGVSPVNFLDDGRGSGVSLFGQVETIWLWLGAPLQPAAKFRLASDCDALCWQTYTSTIDDAKADLVSINVTVGDAPCEVRSPRTHQIITDVPESLDMTWSLGVTNLGQSADTIPW